ncbi:unnamed protein product [Triticum turgidum subsp. durum]|uniref:Uncharacterized protein n=1 Tax=Triticum turgidum subsp. durum TaxID=4567 RepID=A0A9R0U1H7_TRITD|nr:unnamed protein product [Triticum turgidum subsp. durum]
MGICIMLSDWLELPGSLILLTVVAPAIFADTFRGSWLIIGVGVCLVIGCYLLHEHIKASGGLKEAFKKPNGWSNTIGILLLFIYPVPLGIGQDQLEDQHADGTLGPLHFLHPAWGEVGAWIAFVVVILRLFFPRHFPDWLELPGSLILLTVVAPSLFAEHFRNDLVGVFICLAIGCYLLQEHIRVSGGFREAFRKANGVSNTIGIVLLFVYPVWVLVLWLL